MILYVSIFVLTVTIWRRRNGTENKDSLYRPLQKYEWFHSIFGKINYKGVKEWFYNLPFLYQRQFGEDMELKFV